MKYAVKKENEYTGVLYFEIRDDIRTHHAQYGETLEPVWGLENVGTNEHPIWRKVSAPADHCPQNVTMRQARLAMNRAGLLSQIPQLISNLPDSIRVEAEIEWEYAQTVNRDSGLVAILATQAQLTSEQLDELFRSASEL